MGPCISSIRSQCGPAPLLETLRRHGTGLTSVFSVTKPAAIIHQGALTNLPHPVLIIN